MLNRCLEIAYIPLVKYQKAFFIIVSLTLFSMIILESYGKWHFPQGSHTKRNSLRFVRTSMKDIRSSISDVKHKVAEMDRDLQKDPMDNNDFNDLGHIPSTNHKENNSHSRIFTEDPIQPGVGSHLNMGPIKEPNSNSDTFQNETEWDIPQHWLPSYDQKHVLALKHAEHPLDFENEDVLVFLHIPKTSGKSFNSHLVTEMKVSKRIECQCKTLEKPHGCKCLTQDGNIWLFSRLTTAWPCGVHPSWSDLSEECLNRGMDKKEKKNRKRKFSIVTMLRSPYTRYISEWHNVKLDGQWKPFQNLRCYPLTRQGFCYEDNWKGVTLDQFLDCPSNPANNRQVRMLANLHVANCSEIFNWLSVPESSADPDDVNKRYQHIIHNPLLISAMHNLKNLPYFGLEEYQRESEYLFTKAFGYSFKKHFRQSKTFADQVVINSVQRERILDLNRLDLVFYKYAKELFFKRLHENVKRKHVFFTDNIDFTTEAPTETTVSSNDKTV